MKGCRSCKNWVGVEEYLDRDDPAAVNTKVQMGACRRYAPQPHSITGPAGAEAPRIGSFWPLVASDEWCGEWEPGFES
jgi:hypothetical protein